MKLILACTAVVLLSTAVELARTSWRRKNSIAQVFRTANVTPVPQQMLEVYFGEQELMPGTEICPEDAIEMPTISFDFDPDCYYTFLTINIDYSLPRLPVLNPALLTLTVNIYGDSDGLMLEDACEIATWVGPTPAPGTGMNRYVLYVFKQCGAIDATNETLLSYQTDRLGFPFEEFVETYELYPLAGSIFTAQYPVCGCTL